MCPPRPLIYLLFSSLGVMPRVSIALYLPAVYDDDITRLLTNCDENYKFVVYTYSILQVFAVDNKVRKLHAWRTCSNRVLKRSVSVSYELDIS